MLTGSFLFFYTRITGWHLCATQLPFRWWNEGYNFPLKVKEIAVVRNCAWISMVFSYHRLMQDRLHLSGRRLLSKDHKKLPFYGWNALENARIGKSPAYHRIRRQREKKGTLGRQTLHVIAKAPLTLHRWKSFKIRKHLPFHRLPRAPCHSRLCTRCL